jgi:hypothetical protein
MKVGGGVGRITTYRNNENAPVVHFDAPVAWSLHDGVVAIELAFRAMVPVGDGEGEGGPETEGHIAARLRCSPEAARRLRDVLDKMLAKLEQPQSADAVALVVGGKLN